MFNLISNRRCSIIVTVVYTFISVCKSGEISESGCKGDQFISDSDTKLSEKVCAKVYLSGKSTPFDIPTDLGTPYSWDDWSNFKNNSDEIKCVRVSKHHVLRICHLNKLTISKQMICRSSNDHFEKDMQHWDKSPHSVLGFDCGKAPLTEISDANDKICDQTIETCIKAPDLTKKQQCATLYREDNCSNCTFNSIPLYIGKHYEKKKSNLSTIMSIRLRTNCSVTGTYTNANGVEKSYTFQDNKHFTDIYRMNMIYEFITLRCSCSDYDGFSHDGLLPVLPEMGSNVRLLPLIGFVVVLSLLVGSVTLLVVQYVYIKRISKKKLYNAIVSTKPTEENVSLGPSNPMLDASP